MNNHTRFPHYYFTIHMIILVERVKSIVWNKGWHFDFPVFLAKKNFFPFLFRFPFFKNYWMPNLSSRYGELSNSPSSQHRLPKLPQWMMIPTRVQAFQNSTKIPTEVQAVRLAWGCCNPWELHFSWDFVIEDTDIDQPIPIPKVSSNRILAKMIKYHNKPAMTSLVGQT